MRTAEYAAGVWYALRRGFTFVSTYLLYVYSYVHVQYVLLAG